MVRTQVYLTKAERAGLEKLAGLSGKRQSELVREAVELLLEQTSDSRRKAILDRAAGIWRGRTDLPDFRRLRADWDRK